ncbi:uncharacterized protein FOMMEDRAFT_170533 [Fomitiporia mediterranea MF3/22]|uniref:uncharacterized protein n=1 Tax=Fomitiporia mediterranea (strain MF3/22) TaxID=694068 RepID=UPI0004407EA1|nr:uncharacterized protein FOMMEDRAFT_170533 [Fomitiporia mediterranea MF3/22]EJC99193.1 hypothetical protein FOMMEDRAFT_170533 [Fomitiporia mediterranea MF3/22]
MNIVYRIGETLMYSADRALGTIHPVLRINAACTCSRPVDEPSGIRYVTQLGMLTQHEPKYLEKQVSITSLTIVLAEWVINSYTLSNVVPENGPGASIWLVFSAISTESNRYDARSAHYTDLNEPLSLPISRKSAQSIPQPNTTEEASEDAAFKILDAEEWRRLIIIPTVAIACCYIPNLHDALARCGDFEKTSGAFCSSRDTCCKLRYDFDKRHIGDRAEQIGRFWIAPHPTHARTSDRNSEGCDRNARPPSATEGPRKHFHPNGSRACSSAPSPTPETHHQHRNASHVPFSTPAVLCRSLCCVYPPHQPRLAPRLRLETRGTCRSHVDPLRGSEVPDGRDNPPNLRGCDCRIRRLSLSLRQLPARLLVSPPAAAYSQHTKLAEFESFSFAA